MMTDKQYLCALFGGFAMAIGTSGALIKAGYDDWKQTNPEGNFKNYVESQRVPVSAPIKMVQVTKINPQGYMETKLQPDFMP